MAEIYLYIYDLSNGLAKTLSRALIGHHFDGIWHTSLVVYGTEYFFSQEGILSCNPVASPFGRPVEMKQMGHTKMKEHDVQVYLDNLSRKEFKEGAYDLFNHNCNSFTARAVKDLTGNSIPDYITNLTSDFLSTPIGATFRTFMEGASHIQTSGVHEITHFGNGATFINSSSALKPFIFDEPLSSDFLDSNLRNLFSGQTGLAAQWASETLDVLRKLCESDLDPEICSPETFELLNFNRFATFRQCEAICEVFRLAVWRFPEFFVSLFTEKCHNLDQLSDRYPLAKGHISRSEYYNLDSVKARLFCNCIALSCEYQTDFVPSEPVIKLCSRLISFDPSNKDYVFRTAEHEQIGIALSLNIALCPLVSESHALELGASFFHLLEKKKCFKIPLTASFALRTLYAFLKRSDDFVALAVSLDIGSCVGELLSEAENNVDSETPSGSVGDSVAIDRNIAKELNTMLN